MFEVIGNNFALIIILLVIMWTVQFGSAYFQMKRFHARMRELRQGGLTAVGLAGNQYKGRNYAVLTIDDNDKVVNAEQFTGWTIFARLRPVPSMTGMALNEILDETTQLPVSPKLASAFRNAAHHLDKARYGDEAESDMDDYQLEPA